jgi:hypothetical protein
MSLSTRVQSRAMAPAAQRDRALMSEGRKPSEGPSRVAEARRAEVMWAGAMWYVRKE